MTSNIPCEFCSCGLEKSDDYSVSRPIGSAQNGYVLYLNSAGGLPTYIDVLHFKYDRLPAQTITHYYPKYCPECGRKLTENTKTLDRIMKKNNLL